MRQYSSTTNKLFLSLIVSLAITACGGGGSNEETPPITPPAPQPDPVTKYSDIPGNLSTSLGQVLINSDNQTLYTFENDRNDTDGDGANDSDCNDSCIDTWPPMLATDDAVASGNYSIITRDDNSSLQWAYKGLPLYMFVNDSASADVNGEGIGDTWFVARPNPFQKIESATNSVGTIIVGSFTQLTTDGNGGPGVDRADKELLSLYTFENDRNDTDGDGANDSDCNGSCAETWPPLFADKAATANGDYTIIERDDGSFQWALNGLPLYFFSNDVAAGDINGDGIGNVWYLARPTATQVSSSNLGSILSAATPVFNVDGSGAQDTSNRAREGFSLYVFDNDVSDANGDGNDDSDCNNSCAVTWPPMYADAGAVAKGNYSIILRDDATRQWAYKNQPLYFFSGDSATGEVKGDQVGGTWHLARTAPVQLANNESLGDIFAARGLIEDVNSTGGAKGTFSDKTGFTVYLFDDDNSDADGDGNNDSTCNDSCAVTWPPLFASSNDKTNGDFAVITRTDGSLQWAYKGAPLYFFAGDSAVGATGGVYGTWHQVTP